MGRKKKKGRDYRAAFALVFALLLAVCFAACNTIVPGPELRVSNEVERAQAHRWVTTGETLLGTAHLTGVVNSVQYQAGVATIVELRAMIDASAHTPTDWPEVMQRALNLSLAWVVKPPPTPPTQ